MLRCLSARIARQGGSFLKELNASRILTNRSLNYKHNERLYSRGTFPSSAIHAANREPSSPSSKSISSVSGPAALIALQQAGLQLPERCCGCGIRLQQADPETPGYFVVPTKILEMASERLQAGSPSSSSATRARAQTVDMDEDEDEYAMSRDELDSELERAQAEKRNVGGTSTSSGSDSQRTDESAMMPDVICQRCYSLKHQGKVKAETAEGQLPDFDLGKKVGRKIFLQKDRRAVVLCVVDVWDFDGSLPRLALQSLYPPGTGSEAPADLKFKLMVAVNKCDLLPPQVTHARANQWVRIRMSQAGLPKPDKVFLVSAVKGSGVRDMVEDIKENLGFRGDLWVVGAQNAGKSSLISAMKKLGGTSGKREPTIAPMPGTTLGLLNVPGLPLGPKHRAFDTPGVPHDYQLTSQLSLEEVKAVLPSKQLRGRTFRVATGSTLLIGGLARLDVTSTPSSTIYLTIFVSQNIDLHMGKTEGAEERMAKHRGQLLTPPFSPERVKEWPKWTSRDVVVEGTTWDNSSKDIAIAGLGWIGVGCKGKAEFKLWTIPGVAVTTHDALVLDFAKEFEKPGFTSLLPKTPAAKTGVQRV